jgi:hypothetical protein
MNNNDPRNISALEPRDIRQYPNEIARIPERDSVAGGNSESGLSFPEVIAAVNDQTVKSSPAKPSAAKLPADRPFQLWEKEEFGFGDFVDIINPLQHIPIVATIYRNKSGDLIGMAPRVIGGALWGRMGGLVSGVVNAAVDWFTGKDVGDHIYSALFETPSKSVGDSDIAQSTDSTSKVSQIYDAIVAKFSNSSEDVPSSFGAFNDDGGFALGPSVNETALAKEDHFTVPVTVAAANSYATSGGLDEKEEPFRFRFPA